MSIFQTEQDSFILAILASPEDNSPRLIYADWLDEHGQPERAEFIRVQVELARLGPPHVVLRSPVTLSSRLGPNYWMLAAHARDDGEEPIWMTAKAGGRVDLLKPETLRGKKLGPMYGLRVHAIEGDPLNGHDNQATILVEDAESKPWTGEELRRRERELWLVVRPNINAAGLTVCLDSSDVPQSMTRQEYERGLAVVRRGFVSEIRCTLAAFMGGACERCGGEGDISAAGTIRRATGAYTIACPNCHGTGRTLGAVAVFKSQPVTRVVLTDREPLCGGLSQYTWWELEESKRLWPSTHPESNIPKDIWGLIDADGQATTVCKSFQSADAALAALSAACVRYGRSQRNLKSD